MATKCETAGIKRREEMLVCNKLTQIGISFYGSRFRRRMAVFKCECGTHAILGLVHVRDGKTKSCGCLKKQTLLARNTKHDQAITGRQSPTYKAWAAMKRRCKVNPYYTERGIKVCDRWLSFDNFRIDMGEKPEGYSLERIDNNDGYWPQNCRWATIYDQVRNKRNTAFITANGETMCMADWARKTGIQRETLRRRRDMGWTNDAIINTPVRKR